MIVYCIVVTYNGIKWIERCLSSLRGSSYLIKVIVIDNLSADGTVDYIKLHFPEVLLIESSVNLGFGKANNIGIKKAVSENADYVFLLNQDAFLTSECLDILIETSLANKEYGILSPFHLSYKGNSIEGYFKKNIIAIEAPDYISDLYFGKLKKIYAVSFVHAAAWLLPIDTVKKVGGFDPLFFHYAEDIDYVNRVLFFGYKIGFVPHSIMYHFGTNSGINNGKRNLTFERNFAVIKLKDIRSRFRGVLLVFVKTQFDKITSAIVYLRLKDVIFELKVLLNVILRIKKILKARRLCREEWAYL